MLVHARQLEHDKGIIVGDSKTVLLNVAVKL